MNVQDLPLLNASLNGTATALIIAGLGLNLLAGRLGRAQA